MLPAVLPKVMIVKRVPRSGRRETVRSLCEVAGIDCRVEGPAALRRVYVDDALVPSALREPGSEGAVSVFCSGGTSKEKAIFVLGILAYEAHDYAARESMRGTVVSRMSLPVGRPREVHPLSGAERQRRWRAARLAV